MRVLGFVLAERAERVLGFVLAERTERVLGFVERQTGVKQYYVLNFKASLQYFPFAG